MAPFLDDGPVRHQRYQMLVREIRRLPERAREGDARFRGVLDRIAAHFLTADGRARSGGVINPYRAHHYQSEGAAKRHRAAVFALAPGIADVVFAFNRDLNVVLARGVKRMFAVALAQYRQILDERSVLDFADVLDRALELLRRMDEFSQSRFRLEARYHHVLVDEFQDTSRAQWELVALLIQSWGEGAGVTTSPSIFVVGDRKQSIYRFRDAEAAVLQEAARHIQALRPAGNPRRSITKSFRALPTLLAFVNELFAEMADPEPGGGRFTYTENDRFPTTATATAARPRITRTTRINDGTRITRIITGHGQHGRSRGSESSQDTGRFELGIAAANDPVVCAGLVADEIARILREDSVRDRKTGVPRRAPGGGHRRAVPVAREPSRVRARARAPRRSSLRLQGAGLLRRRRDQGRDGVDPVPRQSRVRPAGGGVSAFALHPSLRCGVGDAGAATGCRTPGRRRSRSTGRGSRSGASG